jgi:hypothetical protein
LRRLVRQPFFAAALRLALLWLEPPLRPPLRDDAFDSVLPRPDPDFLPPPDSLFTVAHARAFATLFDTPRFEYPSAMCSAFRFCFPV